MLNNSTARALIAAITALLHRFRETEFVPRVEVLDMQPGDALLVSVPGPLSADTAARIRDSFSRGLSGLNPSRIIVMSDDLSVTKIKASADAPLRN